MEVRGHPMLRRPPPKPQNARNYCNFYEQSGHTITECRQLKKVLHELADKGQIDRFLKRGPWFLRREQEPAQPQPCDEECSTEVVATIAGGYTEGITRSAWKVRLRSAQQVLTTEQGPCEVNLTGMIRLLVRFGNKLRSKNLEVDFFVVDVPAAYNVILGRPNLHKPADARPRSGGKPRNSCPPEILGPASPRPCVNTLEYQSGPGGSLAPWLGPPFPSPWPHQPQPSQAPPLVGVASFSCRLHGHPNQPSAFPNVVGAE
ncbi:hypothetical protein Cgig2_025292 [Carnegiea gigantea]|uniref:Retrotransposon gag domain-containing protein n=1 Tax=Carnegiea gigantea TaxID=171969 RepID=A0A9Q1KB29_9CARY|nr:hypothetical protein Cgig2_025292 [Carnegiea gigantea]